MSAPTFSAIGHFWLPASEDQKSVGTLSLFDDGNARLEVTGAMLSAHDSYRLNSDATKRVLGRLESGESVCLEDCFLKSGSLSKPAEIKCVLLPRIVYRGDDFVFREEKLFDQVVVELENLHDWLGISGIQPKLVFSKDSQVPDISISYKHPESLTIPLADDLILKFQFTFSGPQFGPLTKEVHLTHGAALLLEKKQGMTMDEWLAKLRPIRMLLQLFIGNPVKVESISGRGLLNDDSSSEEAMRRGLTKINPKGALSKVDNGDKLMAREMSLPYSVIKDRLASLVDNWLQSYERYSDGIHLFFTVFEKKHAYLENNFLSLAQGLETIHRRTTTSHNFPEEEYDALKETLLKACPEDKEQWLMERLRFANEFSLRKRLKELLKPFSKFIEYDGGWKKLVQDAVDARNYLTHYEGPPEKGSQVMNVLFIAQLRLEGLFALVLLKNIGLSIDEIDQIRRRNRNLNFLLTGRDWPEQEPE